MEEEAQRIMPTTEPSGLPSDYWYKNPDTGEMLPADDVIAQMAVLNWQQMELLNFLLVTFLVIYIFNTFVKRGRMRQ